MRNGFVKIRTGLEEHLVSGRLSAFDAGVYLMIHLQADFRTGIWTGSAPRLLATAPRGASLRDMQRSLNRLAQIGFLRVFHRQGGRGNYRMLIHKFEPPFGALRGRRLNAEKSESWRSPCYEPRAETVAESDTESGTEAAPYQELEVRIKNKKTSSSPAPPSWEALELASLLRQKILENNPTARLTDSQQTKWARDTDLMLRRDGRTVEQIREVLEWSQGHSFWKGVILSMEKLRKQFDALTVRRTEELKPKPRRTTYASDVEQQNLTTARFVS